MAGPKIRIVCATRGSAAEFERDTALGRSLAAAYKVPFIELSLTPENRQGLPVVYNAAIRAAAIAQAILLFIHDDVLLLDYYWPERLYVALQEFDIVGLVGNRRRLPRQPSWCFTDEQFTKDDFDHMSGFMAHGDTQPSPITRYGPVGFECKLLDGVFLAARSDVLLARGLRFDENFDFDFYDMDFCRQAETKGLRMGTAPISVQHASFGAFATPIWTAAYQRYLAKVGE